MTVEAVQSRSGISARAAVLAYIVVSGLVLLLMMLLGLTMRLAQAQWINIQPDFFYVIMTMHGAGMVGIAGLSGAAVMWYFVRRHVPVSTAVFVANLVFFLIGAVFILGSGFIGGFAAAWTFLFPLPAHSGELWSVNAAACYMVGLLFIGVGFLLLHLDIARGILSVYGGLGAALGVKQAFGLAPEDQGPPPAVTASTMVLIVNILGILLGAAVLVVSLVNLYVPSFTFNALAAKNMIYFFGHVFINATIYMAVIAVYEILPVFTHRKWKTNRAFYFAWVLSTVMVLTVYPHHLLMDFAMPTWALVAGQTHLLAEWPAGAAGDCLRRAHQCLSFRDQVDRRVRPCLRRRGRLGDRCHPGDRRWNHRGEQLHAQHAMGARPLPYLSAAWHGGDVLRLHDLHCPKDDGCLVANRFLALRRRRLDIRAFLPRRRKRQRTAPLRGASAGVVAL